MNMELIIKPQKKFSLKDLIELWQYRELLYFFTWKDLKVRYKQTIIGIAWAIFQPFITMVVFSVFFGKLAKMPSDGIPYPIFVYVGLLIWQFFSSSLSDTSNCLVNNQSIISKIYFPRLILPVSAVMTKLVDFFVSSVILIGMMIYYNYYPSLIGILILPLLLFMTFMLAIGGGLILASINVKYRDVRYILPFFIQMLLFITPVIYPASIAGKYAWVLAVNPMTGIINAAHAAILGTGPIDWVLLFESLVASLIIFMIGILIFKKTEKYFVDLI